jgi:RNA polymerase sigma-70 factor (ECF subfamily)
VLGVLVRMLRDRAHAEEVLQETFVQAWQGAGRFRPELASVRGWLVMMARTRALDRLRASSARARRESAAEAAAGDDRLRSEPVGTAGLEAAERSEAVRRAVDGLPADQRRCIELAFFEGLTHTQIADRVGAPLGTVKSRILLGMNKLRHGLVPYLRGSE